MHLNTKQSLLYAVLFVIRFSVTEMKVKLSNVPACSQSYLHSWLK